MKGSPVRIRASALPGIPATAGISRSWHGVAKVVDRQIWLRFGCAALCRPLLVPPPGGLSGGGLPVFCRLYRYVGSYMDEQAVQVLSSTAGIGERRYQLTPAPSDAWWRAWAKLRDRWSFVEVGRLSPDAEFNASSPDEIVVSGVTEDNAEAVDRGVAALVLATNRNQAKPPRD